MRRRTISLRVVIVLLMACTCPALPGQFNNLKIERISVGQGLDVHRVITILQDRKGFIWLGTQEGIYRYDGYSFHAFKSPPRCLNGNSYTFGTVTRIVQDTSGLIWAVSGGGLFLIDPVTEKSARFPGIGDPNQPYFHYYEAEPDMLYDSGSTIWVTGETGLIRITPDSGKESPKTLQEKLRHPEDAYQLHFFSQDAGGVPFKDPVHTLSMDQWGNIWACYNGGMYVRVKNHDGFFRVPIVDQWLGEGKVIRETESLGDHGIAVATSDGLYILRFSKNAPLQLVSSGEAQEFVMERVLDQPDIMSMHMLGKHELLIGTEFDLLKLDLDSERSRDHLVSMYEGLTNPDQSGYLIGVGDLMVDPTGVLWAGHLYYGLNKILLSSTSFISYEPLIREYFLNTDVNPVHIDHHGDLWVGTFGDGLYHINQNTRRVENYNPASGPSDVECLIEPVPGTFWVGLRGGMLKFDLASRQYSDPVPPGEIKDQLRSAYVLTIAAVDDLVFMGTTIGLVVLDKESGRIRKISMKNDPAAEEEFGFRSLLLTRDGELWTECDLGICRIEFSDLDDIHIIPVIRRQKQEENFLFYAYFLFEDNEGTIWHSSQSTLSRIDRNTGEVISSYTLTHPRDPETYLLARSIQEDSHSRLWIGTQFGLCQFNKETGDIRLFDQNDGLPIMIHGHLSTSRDEDGQFVFGGIGGFYRFHPDSIRLNRNPPGVVITDLRLFNQSVPIDTTEDAILTRSISYTKHIELKHFQNDLAFEFAALDYSDPSKNRYAYMLENYQDEWIETDANHRMATYTNLDPGTYVFRVKGSNNHQRWNETGTSLTVRIYPPWYKTALAYVIYGLTLIASVIGFISLRTRRLVQDKKRLEAVIANRTHDLEVANQQLEEQKSEIQSQRDCLEESHKKISELDRLKTRFFTNISHEFRTLLTLINTPVRNLLEDHGIPTGFRRSLEMVDRNVGKLSTLVNQLLDISRLDRGRVKLMLSNGDVLNFLGATAAAFKATSVVRGIDYRIHIQPGLNDTFFDADKLEKILNNLLSNAFKFTNEGGRVTVAASVRVQVGAGSDESLDIAVSNTGKGIPKDEQGKIFDRFYQAESGLKKEGGGTGIGLALVYELVHLLHGYITVESEADQETVFKVEIPLGKSHLMEDEYTIVEHPEKSTLTAEEKHSTALQTELLSASDVPGSKVEDDHRSRVLIVEDNEEIRWLVAERLKSEFIVLEAVDGSAGLKVATEQTPDLVITDLMMPGMEGTELCRRLKMNLETSHIPIIMLTAKATQDQKLEGLEAGADDYIPKPFDIRELEVRARNLVEQRRLLREKFSNRITLDPGEITITPLDEQFLRRAMEVVESHLGDDTFDVKAFRELMNMSRSTLTRKLQALTDQAPVEFIRTMRLKRAADLLKMGFGNVSEVAMEVGFSNPSYFSKMFRRSYNIAPADYLKSCNTSRSPSEFTSGNNL